VGFRLSRDFPPETVGASSRPIPSRASRRSVPKDGSLVLHRVLRVPGLACLHRWRLPPLMRFPTLSHRLAGLLSDPRVACAYRCVLVRSSNRIPSG
jgi:hypothetical protein